MNSNTFRELYQTFKTLTQNNDSVKMSILITYASGAKYDFTMHINDEIENITPDKVAIFLMDNGETVRGICKGVDEDGCFKLYNSDKDIEAEIPVSRVIGWCYYDETINKNNHDTD